MIYSSIPLIKSYKARLMIRHFRARIADRYIQEVDFLNPWSLNDCWGLFSPFATMGCRGNFLGHEKVFSQTLAGGSHPPAGAAQATGRTALGSTSGRGHFLERIAHPVRRGKG
jgi:hypothetical protein